MAVAVYELMGSRRGSAEWRERGLALRALREELGVKATDVARFMERSDSAYRALEKGYVNISDELIPHLAAALDVAPVMLRERLQSTPVQPPPDLAARVLDVISPRRAHMLADIVRQIEDLSPHDQDAVLELMRVQIAGRRVLNNDRAN